MRSTLTRRAAVALLAAVPTVRAAAQEVPATQSRGPTANVPVTKVLLFSSGVGYFEHSGIVHGNGTTELRFKTSEINDIRSPPRAYASIWRSGRRMIHHATIQRGATHHEHGLENA